MKLDRLVLVNWGSLRPGNYPMGDMTLLTGPTGSGKSTFLDALQTIMTAVYQNVFNFNPGQDETTQNARNGKTKRTLWSYIAGGEDNLFARPDGAHGYIAAVFRPSEGESGKPFSAIVAASAKVDGSGGRRHAVQDRLFLLIADDAALSVDDILVNTVTGSLEVIPVERIETHLKSKYPKLLNLRDTKREYLCQLYGRFRGQKSVSFAEAELAAKAWTQSIAYQPIGSVDELVKTQILEHDTQQLTQRIAQISEMMRQVQTLRKEGERLQKSVGRLEKLLDATRKSTSAYEAAMQYELLASKRLLRQEETRLSTTEAKIASLSLLIDTKLKENRLRSQTKEDLTSSLVLLRARLAGIPVAQQKNALEGRIERARQTTQLSIEKLLRGLHSAKYLHDTARTWLGLELPPSFIVLRQSLLELGGASERLQPTLFVELQSSLRSISPDATLSPDVIQDVARDIRPLSGRFDELYARLAGAEKSVLAAAQEELSKLRGDIEKLEETEKGLLERKRNLADGGADYPHHVAAALRLIRTELPEAHPQVLCDLIEPVSKEWQAAIEGYLDGARFNFVVPSELEAQTIEFIREKHLRVRVIQGAACLKAAKSHLVTENSIIHELRTDHPVARAYLVDLYGAVVKVHSDEELRFTPRGVMKDGKASGSRTMFVARVDSCVFGKEAQRAARDKVIADCEHVGRELRRLQEHRQQLSTLVNVLRSVAVPDFGAVGEFEQSVNDLALAVAELKHLDLTALGELESEEQSIKQQVKDLEDQIASTHQIIGNKNNEMEVARQSLGDITRSISQRREQLNVDRRAIEAACTVNVKLSLAALEREVEQWLESATTTDASGTAQKNRTDAVRFLGDVRELLGEYNRDASTHDHLALEGMHEYRGEDFAPAYRVLLKLDQEIRSLLTQQRDMGLVKNVEQLRQAEASFKDVFTKQFCYEVRNAVDNGTRTLRALNMELDRLKFGTDKFSIDWSTWVPEYKEYYDFFSAAYLLADSNEAEDLFRTQQLTPRDCEVRDRLVTLLLSDEHEQALKELQRIADYRNYRRYEIWKSSDTGSRIGLSEWGTGSGGQLETPAYIVRAAVVTNRLKHFEKGMNLKLLANDESFAKMDERRAHDVIKFVRDSLGIQLICAMPTKHAGGLKSEFTKEWCFTRTSAENNGEVDFVSEVDERNLNPDKLRELWEARRTQVRTQAALAFEQMEQR